MLHVSNRFIDLEPLVGEAAKATGWMVALQDDGPTPEEEKLGKTQSRWMMLARDKATLVRLGGLYWSDTDVRVAATPWTDDRSDLLTHLKGEGE